MLYRNLQRVANHGVVPLAAFEAETAALALDETARVRLISALSELNLHLETPSLPATRTHDSEDVKKVVQPRTETSQTEYRPHPAVTKSLGLLGRYVVDGVMTDRAVAGVARLAGLTPAQTSELRGIVAGRYSLRRVEAPQDGHRPTPDEDMHEPEAGPALPRGSATDTGDLASAVAAARAVIEDDRHTRRPEKRILKALEEVGLSVLLRGGPDRVDAEPTDEELAKLPVGDIRRLARDCLVLHNQGLAWSSVRTHIGQGLDEDDLFQHGMLGILRAVRKFDPRQGNKFSTYATWWVRQAITRALADEGSAIRIPVHMHELVRKVGRVERDLTGAGQSRSAAVVAVACDLSVSKVEEIRRISRVTDSTDRIIGDGTHLGELLEKRTSLPSVEVAVMATLANEGAHALVALLPERFARVVTLRIGLDGEDPATLDVIGAELGVTRERVRQLESQVFAVLRVAFQDPAGNPHTALAGMLADAQGDNATSNPVGAISRNLGKPEWRAGIKALTAFRAREGSAAPGPDHVEDGFPLGEWVTAQRVEGRVGGHRLPAHRRIVLNALGMVWAAPKPEEAWRRTQRARRRARHAAGSRRLARPGRQRMPAPVTHSADSTDATPGPTPSDTAAVVEEAEAAPRPNLPELTGTTSNLLTVKPAVLATAPQVSPDASPLHKPSSVTQLQPQELAEPAPSVSSVVAPAPENRPPAEITLLGVAEVPQAGLPSAGRYTDRWDEAVALSLTLNRSVRWTAHYVHLALGHVLLSEILGLYPALTVAKVADGSKLPDRPVAQAIDILVRLVDGLKEREARPEDFFEWPSPALLGRSPRAYLAAYPLTKPEARLALADALQEFPRSREAVPAEETEAASVSTPPGAQAPVPGADDTAALHESRVAAAEAVLRLRELEAEVTDRIAQARAAERNNARVQVQAEATEAAQRIRALEASVADQVANARAEERNRARAAAQAEMAQQVTLARDESARLVREAEAAAEARLLQATSAMAGTAQEREARALRRMEEEYARRVHEVEESARQEVQVLEARLRQAEAAFAERVQAAQAVQDEAAERVRTVERWAELRLAEERQTAQARIAELEAQLAPVRKPEPAPAPQQPDPRRWWRRP